MIKVANNVQAMLIKQAKKVKTKDITFGGIDSVPNTLADYVYGVGGGGPTTGHAFVRGSTYQTLAEAARLPADEVGFTVRHPAVSTTLSTLGGLAGGAGLGYLASYLSGMSGKDMDMFGLGGAGVGALTANLLTTLARRDEMRRIADAFEGARSLKKLKPAENTISSRLNAMFSSTPHPGIRNQVLAEIAATQKGK